jgi:hypothetical protein
VQQEGAKHRCEGGSVHLAFIDTTGASPVAVRLTARRPFLHGCATRKAWQLALRVWHEHRGRVHGACTRALMQLGHPDPRRPPCQAGMGDLPGCALGASCDSERPHLASSQHRPGQARIPGLARGLLGSMLPTQRRRQSHRRHDDAQHRTMPQVVPAGCVCSQAGELVSAKARFSLAEGGVCREWAGLHSLRAPRKEPHPSLSHSTSPSPGNSDVVRVWRASGMQVFARQRHTGACARRWMTRVHSAA